MNDDWQLHLQELRWRLIQCLLLFLIIFSVLFYFRSEIYHLFALPLLNYLPKAGKIIATNVIAPFLVPLRLVFVLTIFIVMPFFLYQIGAFIVPGLYIREKTLLWPLLGVSILLFYLGILFTYFIVLPLTFRFIMIMVPSDIFLMPDMGYYLDFILQLFLVFGISFEVPVIVMLLLMSGLVQHETMRKMRPYVIVLAFILGMLLTPPDVVSQILLAIPLWMLFELGLILEKILPRLSSTPPR